MASLLSWAKKEVGRVGNTLNNDIVKPIQRDVVQPVQQAAAPVVQRAQAVAAQVNPVDNSRTYNTVMQRGPQYAPKPPKSVLYQGTHNGLSNTLGSAVKFVPQFSVDLSNASANLGNRLGGAPRQSVKQQFKDPFTSRVANVSGATGTNRQLLGAGAQVALSALTPGVDNAIAKSFESVAPKVIPKIIPKTIARSGSGAIAIPAFSEANYAGSNQPITKQGVIQTAKQGAQTGALLGLGGELVGAVAPAVAKSAIKTTKVAAPKVAQTVQKVTSPQEFALNQNYKQLQKQLDSAKSQNSITNVRKAMADNRQALRDHLNENQGGFVKIPGGTNEQDQLVQSTAAEYKSPEEFLNDTASAAHNLDKSLKGGQLIPDGEQYGHGMKRTSEHTPFYSNFYAQNKKAPTLKDYKSAIEEEFNSGKSNMAHPDEHEIYQLLKDREIANNSLAKTPGQSENAPQPASSDKTPLLPQESPNIANLSNAGTPNPPNLNIKTNVVEKPTAALPQPPKTNQSVDTLNVPKTSQEPISTNTPTNIQPVEGQKTPINIPGTHESLSNNTPVTPVLQERGFTKSVKQSANYTKPLKQAIKGTSQYATATDKEAIANTQKFTKQPLNVAHADILNRLQSGAKLSKQDVVNGGTIMQHLDSAGRTAEAQVLHEQLAAHLTNAGQLSQAASLLLRRSPDGIYHKAVSDLKKAGTVVTPDIDKQLRGHREAIRKTTPDTPERDRAIQEMKQFVSKNIPTGKLNNVYAFWRAGLLTGPRTVGKILTSHGLHLPLEKIKDVPASMIDQAVSKVSHQRSLVLTTKGKAGLAEGAKAGFGKKGYFRTGVDIQPGNNSVEFHQNANYGSSVPGKVVQAYVDGIGRLHGSLYKPFFGYGHLNSLYSLAKAEVKNQGLKGAEADTFTQDFVKSPPAWAQDIAKNDAENLTFQQKTQLGQFASAIQQHGGIVGKAIAPFTKIPSAIATDLFNYSPVGAMKTILDGIKAAKSEEGWTIADQRKFAQGLGRSITGTAAIAPGYLLYQKGLMTLAYPTDPKEQKLWQLEGKTADSVKIGGKWRSLGSLGPVGSILSIGGYLGESQARGETVTQSALNALAGGLKTIEDQPYVSGISGVTNALQDPGRYLNSLEKQYAGSVIPTGVAQVATSFDKLQRQANNAGDTVKSKIPGLRESLAPKTNAFGQNVPSGETGPSALVDPFYSSKSLPQSPLVGELQRLNNAGQGTLPSPQPTKNTFDGISAKLSKPQAQALGAKVGQTVQVLWDQTIASPVYKNLPDDQKHQMLSNILSDTTTAVKEQYASDNNLGQYAPGFSGKPQPLSQKQQNIIDGKFNPSDYTQKQSTSTKPRKPRSTVVKNPKGIYVRQKIASTPRVKKTSTRAKKTAVTGAKTTRAKSGVTRSLKIAKIPSIGSYHTQSAKFKAPKMPKLATKTTKSAYHTSKLAMPRTRNKVSYS